MESNLSKYKKDLKDLILLADHLSNFLDDKFEKETTLNDNFEANYQAWYSESQLVIKQLLPNRMEEFNDLYHLPKRRELNAQTYGIQDWLIGRRAGIDPFVGKFYDDIGITFLKFQTQKKILESAFRRFDSSLFEIKQLLQADLFDSEIEAAKELRKKGFLRAAGAVCGVILESHLAAVCSSHNKSIKKKNKTINDFNQALKEEDIIDIPSWRFIQRLGDLRNLCDHKKDRNPTEKEIEELIDGTDRIVKSIF